MGGMADRRITVFLADDNVIVREGVRALLGLEANLKSYNHQQQQPPSTHSAPNVIHIY